MILVQLERQTRIACAAHFLKMPPFISPSEAIKLWETAAEGAGAEASTGKGKSSTCLIFSDWRIYTKREDTAAFALIWRPVFLFLLPPHTRSRKSGPARRGASLEFSRSPPPFSYTHKQFSHSEKSARKQREQRVILRGKSAARCPLGGWRHVSYLNCPSSPAGRLLLMHSLYFGTRTFQHTRVDECLESAADAIICLLFRTMCMRALPFLECTHVPIDAVPTHFHSRTKAKNGCAAGTAFPPAARVWGF